MSMGGNILETKGSLLEQIDKLKQENEKLIEFVQDCSVSHVESRYKYRAQVLLKGIDKE